MKRLPALALLCLSPLLLSACNQGDKQADADQQAAAPAASPAPDAAKKPAVAGSVSAAFLPLELAEQNQTARAFCALDRINAQAALGQTISLEAGGQANFIGWVADSTLQVPEHFKIVLSGSNNYGAESTAGGGRPDVARALNSDALKSAGFKVMASLGDVAPGDYAVSVIVEADGKFSRCATTTRITVVKSAG